jgi:predicted secreted Zn-dependent protease
MMHMTQHLLACFALLLWLTACASGPAKTSHDGRPLPTLVPIEFPKAVVRYYDITGSTEQDLRHQMTAQGPEGYDAFTRWNVRWNWPGRGEADCRLKEAEVSYEVTVTFPRWMPTAETTPELVAKWNRYVRALADHEQLHVDNVVKRFPAVVAAIRNATCLTAEAAAQAALNPIRLFDAQYDLNTDHGRTQGARFP